MFIHTRSSIQRRFAKFGWQTRTFCYKKEAFPSMNEERLLAQSVNSNTSIYIVVSMVVCWVSSLSRSSG